MTTAARARLNESAVMTATSVAASLSAAAAAEHTVERSSTTRPPVSGARTGGDGDCDAGVCVGVEGSDSEADTLSETDGVAAGVGGAVYAHATPTLPPALELNSPTRTVNEEPLNAGSATRLDKAFAQPSGALSLTPARQPNSVAPRPQPVPT